MEGVFPVDNLLDFKYFSWYEICQALLFYGQVYCCQSEFCIKSRFFIERRLRKIESSMISGRKLSVPDEGRLSSQFSSGNTIKLDNNRVGLP